VFEKDQGKIIVERRSRGMEERGRPPELPQRNFFSRLGFSEFEKYPPFANANGN
jgi:hypothetical protein